LIGRGKNREVKWQELRNEVRRRENNQSYFQQVGAESRIHQLDTARREETNKSMTEMKEECDTERQSGPYPSIGMREVRVDIREGGVWQGKGSQAEKTEGETTLTQTPSPCKGEDCDPERQSDLTSRLELGKEINFLG
jgi:hypothetical protein